jgi:hypothetical protein
MVRKNVFKLWQSMDDYNQTHLYGGLNEAIDWAILREISEGKRSVSDYKPMSLKLKTNKILKKDLIQAPAGAYFISEKFKIILTQGYLKILFYCPQLSTMCLTTHGFFFQKMIV